MKNTRAIYKFKAVCKDGELNGIFTETMKNVQTMIDNKFEIFFGEVLGRDSEVVVKIFPENLQLVSEKEPEVEMFESLNLSNGFNPFEYGVCGIENDKVDMADVETCGTALDVCKMINLEFPA